jgi:hypothetical protein
MKPIGKDKLKLTLLILLFNAFSFELKAQKTDMIVVKKKNHRTLKTYFPGAIILAETYDGFKINGIIKDLRNDSIILQQRETRLRPTDFGSRLDTLYYTMGVSYSIIEKYYFENSFSELQGKEFGKTIFPKMMSRGGVAFIVLEFVNSLGRKESLTEKNKLVSFGISSFVAGTGMLWSRLHKTRNRVGGKYVAVYVKKGTLSLEKVN